MTSIYNEAYFDALLNPAPNNLTEEEQAEEEEERRRREEEEARQRELQALTEEEEKKDIEEEEEAELEAEEIARASMIEAEEEEEKIIPEVIEEEKETITVQEAPIRGGRYLKREGEADGIIFYKDDTTDQYITTHTVTHETPDGKYINMPSVLQDGYFVGINPSASKTDRLYNYWRNADPSKLEIFDSEERAIESAKLKSLSHDQLGKKANIIKDVSDEDAGLYELGTYLERWTIGNVGRLGQAGLKSLTDDLTFKEAIKEVEKERTEKIYTYMQEKYGRDFKGREDEMEVMAGRVATAFLDPITFILPWAKAAKMGKLAATGFGAGVGVGDTALYQYAANGEVSTNSLLFAGTLGGVSSFGGKLLGDKFAAPVNKEVIAGVDEAGKPIIKKSTIVDEPDIKLTAKELEDLEKADVLLLQEKELSKVFDNLISDMAVMPKFTERVNKATDDIYNYNKAKVAYGKGQQFSLFGTKQIITPQKLGALKRKANQAQKFLDKDQTKILTKIADGQAKLVDGVLTIHSKQGTLSDNILQTILYESFRPLMGGALGYLTGSFVADEDSDPSVITSFIATGMFLGLAQRQIQKNPFIDQKSKQKAFGIFKNQKMIALHNFLKIHTSGTAASKGVAHGGPVETATRLLFDVPGNQGKTGIISAEMASNYAQQRFGAIVGDVIGTTSPKLQSMAWRIVRGLDDDIEKVIKKNKLDAAQAQNLKNLVANTELFKDTFVNEYVRKAGKEFDEISDYGLPQFYLFDKINADPKGFKKQLRKAVKEQWKDSIAKLDPAKRNAWITERTDDIFDSVANIEKKKITIDSLVKRNRNSSTGIPLLDNFDKKRQITDLKAIQHIEGYLDQKLDRILFNWIDNTTKGIEFGRAMGIRTSANPRKKGRIFQNLRTLRQELNNQRKAGKLSDKQFKDKRDYLENQINVYFKTYGVDQTIAGDKGRAGMALLTFLSNTTMLTRSGIAQLADLVQPFQNSGNFAAARALIDMHVKGKDFAKQLGYAGYKDSLMGTTARTSFRQDKLALQSFGDQPATKLQSWINTATEKFFRYNQMTPLTDYSRKFSFNTGIREGFIIAKKYGGQKKVSKRIQNKMSELSLSANDLKYIRKFDKLDDVMADTVGQSILVKAGLKGQDFNTLVPLSGNRLHFSQHHDPYVRSLGMFLSWAQAKTAQMNSLVKRIEDGDVALAVKMLGALTVYGGIRELQIVSSPSVKYYEENKPERFSNKWIQEAATLGGVIPWPVEKISRFLGGGSVNTPIENITPIFAYLNRLLGAPAKIGADLGVGDYVGAIIEALKPIPMGREMTRIVNSITGGKFEDIANDEYGRNQSIYRDRFFKGGEVSKENPVPNANPIPAERINPYTGEPYAESTERVEVKDGGLLVSIGVAPVSEKQIDKLKSKLKERKAKREGGEVRQQYGLGDIVKRALKKKADTAKHIAADVLLGADRKDIEDLDQRTINALIKNIDKIENEREREAVLRDIEKYNSGVKIPNLSSPAFNALRHAKLSYEYGDKPFARSALIAKEQAQSRGIAYKGDFKTSLTEAESRAEKIDALNNVAAFRIKDERPNLDDQQFNEEFIKRFNESANTPTEQLKPGKHFYLRESDAIGVKMPSMFIHPSAKFTN
jgi:hypothetical protein